MMLLLKIPYVKRETGNFSVKTSNFCQSQPDISLRKDRAHFSQAVDYFRYWETASGAFLCVPGL